MQGLGFGMSMLREALERSPADRRTHPASPRSTLNVRARKLSPLPSARPLAGAHRTRIGVPSVAAGRTRQPPFGAHSRYPLPAAMPRSVSDAAKKSEVSVYSAHQRPLSRTAALRAACPWPGLA